MDNVDTAYDYLETSILEVLEVVASMKRMQPRRECRTCLSEDTKELMNERDTARERARDRQGFSTLAH